MFFDKPRQLAPGISSFSASRGRNAGHPAPPAQSRTCGFPASGSSVRLASARIFTVTRFKIQLLFPAVRLARVIQPYMSGTSFLCGLRPSVRSFPLHAWFTHPCGRLSRPLSTMPDKTPQWHIAALRRPTCVVTPYIRSTMGLPEFFNASLPACHGLLTPVDLHTLAFNGCFCVAFGDR